jgi:hypothetical protein
MLLTAVSSYAIVELLQFLVRHVACLLKHQVQTT